MRAMAADYVPSDLFAARSTEELDTLIGQGFQADCAISLWVIQHVYDPAAVIGRIERAMHAGGRLSMNERQRIVPTNLGWCDDRLDVPAAWHRVCRGSEPWTARGSDDAAAGQHDHDSNSAKAAP